MIIGPLGVVSVNTLNIITTQAFVHNTLSLARLDHLHLCRSTEDGVIGDHARNHVILECNIGLVQIPLLNMVEVIVKEVTGNIVIHSTALSMEDGVVGGHVQRHVTPECNIGLVRIQLLNMVEVTVKEIVHKTATLNIALLIVYGVVLAPV
ncbi:MAG: hypothetical protein WA061_04455 [Microgenomates group bacterium]